VLVVQSNLMNTKCGMGVGKLDEDCRGAACVRAMLENHEQENLLDGISGVTPALHSCIFFSKILMNTSVFRSARDAEDMGSSNPNWK
jgi:hypothetical protein